MTTAAQIKRLLKPLLARSPDLIQRGKWLFLRPVHHIARAILIDRTGSANVFQPTWAALALVERTDVFSISWGERLAPPAGGLWKWDDPNIAEALIEVVEHRALPRMRPIETLEKFVAFASSRERFPLDPFDSFPLIEMPVSVARGEFDAARSCCEELLSGRTRWSTLWPNRFKFVTETICPLLMADDRSGLIALLHEWEAYSAKHLGLEGIWEPTPFPLEEQIAP